MIQQEKNPHLQVYDVIYIIKSVNKSAHVTFPFVQKLCVNLLKISGMDS